MAIEFKHGGRTWRADTPEEAIALRKRLETEDEAAIAGGERPDWVEEQVWTPDTVMDLLRNAGPLQKKFLLLLNKHDNLTSTEVVQKLKLGSEVALAGVLSGLSKQLKKMGLNPWDLYTTTVSWSGKRKTRRFRLGDHFTRMAGGMGWPDKWPKKKE